MLASVLLTHVRKSSSLFLLLLLGSSACASSAPARKPSVAPAKTIAPVEAASVAEPPPPPPAPTSRVKIKGLTGTLNTDDVHQTMDARQDALNECITQCRRRLRWISGSIRFSFKVDAEGAVVDVHATESDLGHYNLETCITTVLHDTRFPKPAGSASAEFEWGLSVEPATRRIPEVVEADFLEPVLRKHTDEIFEHCEVKRREHYQITAYINRRGKLVSAGAISKPAGAVDKLGCVLEELASLRIPKRKKDAKVSFELK